MVRGRLAVVVGLLASGVAWGNPTPGTIWGYVIWPNGQPMQAAQVYALPAAGTPGETDNDGRYEITGVAPGNYEVYINTEYCCHEPQSLHRPATVAAGQTLRLDFTPQPLIAQPEIEIGRRLGKVEGNLTGLKLEMTWEACTVWPKRFEVGVDCPARNHDLQLFVGEVTPEWVEEHIVGYAWDERDVLWAFGEVVVPWDTTLCANASYDIGAKVWFDNSFCGNQPDIEVSDVDWATVRNVVITDVQTSAGNPDYFTFNANAESGSPLLHPTVAFNITDAGPRAGPYRWTLFVRDTRASNWEQGEYAWIQGTATGPGAVTATIHPAEGSGQTQSTPLTEWGTYAFDVKVEELETLPSGEAIDVAWSKWPYLLTLGEHSFWFEQYGPDHWVAKCRYQLNDSQHAKWAQVDLLDPELQVVASNLLPCETNVMHEDMDIGLLADADLKAGTYIAVFKALDAHGDDTIAISTYQVRWYREGEDKRMLACNKRVDIPWVFLTIDGTSEADEEVPGAYVMLNGDQDEGNLDPLNAPVADNQPHDPPPGGDPLHRIVPGDNELRSGRLVLRGPLRFVSWTLTWAPTSRLKVWYNPDGQGWVEVTSGQAHDVGTIPAGPNTTIEILVEGMSHSDTFRDVRLTASATGRKWWVWPVSGTDAANVTVVDCKLRSVEFAAAEGAAFAVNKDRPYTATSYPTPHWQDNNDDNDAYDQGDHRSPVCYEHGSRPRLTATVGLPFQAPRWKVRATSDLLGGALVSDWLTPTGTNVVAVLDATSCLPNTALYREQLPIDWAIQAEGETGWIPVGSSANQLYVVLASTLPDPSSRHTILHYACKGADGRDPSDTDREIADAIFNEYKDCQVLRVPPPNEAAGDLKLHYYLDWDVGASEAKLLLQAGDGQCHSWGDALVRMLAVHGVLATWDPYEATEADYDYMGVAVWRRNGPHVGTLVVTPWSYPDFFDIIGTPPNQSYGWHYAEVEDGTGVRGQGPVANPASLFAWHALVRLFNDGSVLYDPSYGLAYHGQDRDACTRAFWATSVAAGLDSVPDDSPLGGHLEVDLSPREPQ